MKKFVIITAIVFFLCSCSKSAETDNPVPEVPLEVTVFDVGKADAMLLRTAEHTAVIDCGEKGDGKKIVSYLENCGTSAVDYLIITHYDKDHVGGSAKVIKELDVANVLVPDYNEENNEKDKFFEAMADKNITPVYVTENFEFSLGEAKITVLPPENSQYSENSDNNHSLVAKVMYGNTSLLFAGDAVELRLSEIMNTGHCDFLKVPYHGREIANLDDFLDAVSPEIAAVSTSADEFEIAGVLESHGIDYRTTFSDGQINITSDGKRVYFVE